MRKTILISSLTVAILLAGTTYAKDRDIIIVPDITKVEIKETVPRGVVYKPSVQEIKISRDSELIDKMENIIENEWGKSRDTSRTIAQAVIDTCNEMNSKYSLNLHPQEIMGIIATESSFNSHETSDVGARGLMQVTPSALNPVCEAWGVSSRSLNMYNIKDNIRVGSYYYGVDKAKYGQDHALVAYNQGYNNLSRAVTLSRGNSRSYLSTVTRYMNKYEEELK